MKQFYPLNDSILIGVVQIPFLLAAVPFTVTRQHISHALIKYSVNFFSLASPIPNHIYTQIFYT